MASTPIEICNYAANMLGAASITSFADGTTASKAFATTYEMTRDAELRGPGVWSFAVARTTLAALATVPASGPYGQQFELPADCLRVLMAGDWWPGSDQSDYRTAPPNADYLVEGGMLLCDQAAPLSLRYVAKITDTTRYDAHFTMMLAAKLAWRNCERLTQSKEKRQLAITEYKQARSEAVRTAALELPPQFAADDTWILSRMQ